MRFRQQARAQSRGANRVRFIENRFAPCFETRERHQKSEPNNQGQQSQKGLLKCGNVTARTMTLGAYAYSPSKFGRQKDNGGTNEKNDNKGVVGEVLHDRT